MQIMVQNLMQFNTAPQMITAPHSPVPFSPALEDLYIPGAGQIVDAIRKTLEA
jgi:pyruvate dehydrogenase E1 component beta subunit